jgi:hypothetical protein
MKDRSRPYVLEEDGKRDEETRRKREDVDLHNPPLASTNIAGRATPEG